MCCQLFADFLTLPAPKMAKRLQLCFSQTVRCLEQYKLHLVRDPAISTLEDVLAMEPPSDEKVVNIVEIDDRFGDQTDRENTCLTDGAGLISLDLMRGIPSIDNGQVLVTEQRVDPKDPPELQSAPVVVQSRLWYLGSLAKGLWLLYANLPLRTLVVCRQKQRKVEGRRDCVAAQKGISSFEVIRTFDRPIPGKLDAYLAPLLEVAAGSRKPELHTLILRQQGEEANTLLSMLNTQFPKWKRKQEAKKVLERLERKIDDKVSVADAVKVFDDPLGEPYLAQKLKQLQLAALKKLRVGKVLLPHSNLYVIVPDFTGSLKAGEVAPFIHGQQLQRSRLTS